MGAAQVHRRSLLRRCVLQERQVEDEQRVLAHASFFMTWAQVFLCCDDEVVVDDGS